MRDITEESIQEKLEYMRHKDECNARSAQKIQAMTCIYAFSLVIGNPKYSRTALIMTSYPGKE